MDDADLVTILCEERLSLAVYRPEVSVILQGAYMRATRSIIMGYTPPEPPRAERLRSSLLMVKELRTMQQTNSRILPLNLARARMLWVKPRGRGKQI